MSLFAPGKPTPVAHHFVDQQRAEWGEWARTSHVISVIGARPLMADPHIWAPIIETKVPVFYIGGTSGGDFDVLKRKLRGNLHVIGSRFGEALPKLNEEA